MAADGTIAITLEVNPEDANAGLGLVNKALEGFAKQAKESGKDFSAMIGDVDAAAKQLSKQTGASFKETKKAISDFQKQTTADTKRLAKEQQKAAKEMAKANGSNIVGIETLSDKTGEFDSAIKGAASGVDLFSKSAGKNLWFLGEMAGGIEGGARLTKLFGGTASKMAIPLGLLGVAAVGVGAAIFGMGKKARGAKVDMEALGDALEAARTSALSVEGVKLQIGARLGAHGLLLRRWRWGCPVSRVMMPLRFTPAFALPAACFCFAGTESSSMALRELGPYSRDPAGLEGTQGRVTGGM